MLAASKRAALKMADEWTIQRVAHYSIDPAQMTQINVIACCIEYQDSLDICHSKKWQQRRKVHP
jgi:hypothetical protein